ncbi:hypothetical protein M5689_024201 [Euphorbia peplus]|nr:hypothetical protein M5689_024201 [Euphorbia peplus]
MEGKSCESNRQKHNGEGPVAEYSNGKPMIGDITWVKLSTGSWWPALVVGGDDFSDGLTEDVRVRLYGSYEYMLVDPTKWHFEFQITLKENNGCYQDILRKALEQDMSSSESDQVRGKRSKSKGTSGKRVSQKRKNPNHVRISSTKDGMQKKRNSGSSTQNEVPDGELSGRSPELSARRIKVMQTLGLAAPSGSPFRS